MPEMTIQKAAQILRELEQGNRQIGTIQIADVLDKVLSELTRLQEENERLMKKDICDCISTNKQFLNIGYDHYCVNCGKRKPNYLRGEV